MALWRLYYHLVWATKEREPLIIPNRETAIYHYIVGKADGSIVPIMLIWTSISLKSLPIRDLSSKDILVNQKAVQTLI